MAVLNALRGMLVLTEQRVPTTQVKMTGMQVMASRMWPLFTAMGFLIILASLAYGVVLANFTSDYLAFPREVRDQAAAGSSIVDKKVFIETTKVWLPAFKFLGLGLLLGGITFLLATIIGTLRLGGGVVQQAFGREVVNLKPPLTANLFPMLMMLGLMVLMATLALSIVVAFIAHGYWNHSIANELSTAPEGSALAENFKTIKFYTTWLPAFKFAGIALMLSGIMLSLHTIIYVMRFRSRRMREMVQGVEGPQREEVS
ncbi:MAG: hypothetical protein ACE5IZ_06275 [Dehalococcoidia bacterium]